MTISERINWIREDKELSQEAFGKRIGISRNAVSLIEKGINNPSRQTIDLICREFNVSRDWLETGEGETYVLPLDEDTALFSEVIKLGEGRATVESIKAVLKMYLSLDESGRRTLDKLITDAVERTKKDPE